MPEKPKPSSDDALHELPPEMFEEDKKYTPRPKWQVILAWVLVGIMVVSILNLCYWEIFQG